MTSWPKLYTAFGAQWQADTPLAHFDLATRDRSETAASIDAIRVRRVAALTPRKSLHTVNGGCVYVDGFRLAWHDEVTFDVHDGSRIDYVPGPGWTGDMPAAFYSTVAALTLAARGALPCHASAVEFGGKAVLLAGAAGAGKSTLAASLLTRGGRLLADDLTIIAPVSPDGPFIATRGRPGIRLHCDTALRVAAVERHSLPGDQRGKWLVRPIARSPYDAVPLAGVVLLGDEHGTLQRGDNKILLGPHLFRPRWLAALPGHADRLRMTLEIASRVPSRSVGPGEGFYRDPAAIERAWSAITTMLAR
ncbi:MAG: hypothetical protein JWL96_3881 [Sphingomonas bacterium]|uniref:hypothetical protein n=1 Tax=Sphingomonas bacterium TaxID=1895847 RepID=UPI00260AF45F|nr:hypothetical protein [Sphingomonas bacterium]MDB5711811.1 hypothetical protein [Sphingomonas bacterium]